MQIFIQLLTSFTAQDMTFSRTQEPSLKLKYQVRNTSAHPSPVSVGGGGWLGWVPNGNLMAQLRRKLFTNIGGEGGDRMRWLEGMHRYNGHEFEQTLGHREGQGSLTYCSPRGHKQLDTAQWLNNNSHVGNASPSTRLRSCLSPSPPLVSSGIHSFRFYLPLQ